MSYAILTFVALFLCILFRLLNVNSQPARPMLYCKDEAFLNKIYKIAPILREPYIPTRLWGFSGHVQTILHSIVGRVKCPWPLGERNYLALPDNSTLTYDLYRPIGDAYEDDITLAVCPGIGNSSETVYIRTFVHYAQCLGYRCVVLNHIGALPSVQVTSPRIFSYGHTTDFEAMLTSVTKRFPSTRICLVGFSIGGNLVTKYLGDPQMVKPEAIIGAISVCQGYNAVQATNFLLSWQNFRRFYLYVMTENMKGIIMRHRQTLLSEEAKDRYGLNERHIFEAATLPELDEAYTRRIHNFETVNHLYKWSSSVHYLETVERPMVFINAKDDPLVPVELLDPIRKVASEKNSTIYVELNHGGHLGFYEGGLVYPNPVTWLDRAILSIVGGLVLSHNDKGAPGGELLKTI